MLSAVELRKSYQAEREAKHLLIEEKERLLKENIKKDYQVLYGALEQILYKLIEEGVKRGRDYIIVNDYMRLFSFDESEHHSNIKASTFFTGMYDKETRKHDKSIFVKADVPDILTHLQTTFSELGYTITDISDSSRSFAKILKIDIGR